MCCQDAKGCLLLSLSRWTCAGCIIPPFPLWKAFEAGSMCALDERLGGDRLASRRPLSSAQNFGSANCHVRSKTALLLGLLHAQIENSLNRTKMLDAACCTAQIPLIIAFPSHSTTKWPCHIAINPPKPTSKKTDKHAFRECSASFAALLASSSSACQTLRSYYFPKNVNFLRSSQ